MKYEEFLELIKKKAHQELGYPKDQIKYYEKGFTSDNPQMAEWIRDCNMRFMDKEGSELLTDFLVL